MREVLQKLIHQTDERPLSTVAFHHDVPCIQRFFSESFPMHLAIHQVSQAWNVESYTEPHYHDVPEINIIIGDEAGDLAYEIQLGDEIFEVTSNATVWIPAGMMHASNVIKGSGYFIALRLNGFFDGQLLNQAVASTSSAEYVNGR